MEQSVVTSITSESNQAKFTVYGGKSSKDFSSSILNLLAQKNIFVDVIVMNYELNGAIDFSFTVQQDNFSEVESILKENKGDLFNDYISESNLSKISVVGVGMRSQTGVASRVFICLEGSNTSLKLVSTSEIKITLVLESSLEKTTVESLHREFFK